MFSESVPREFTRLFGRSIHLMQIQIHFPSDVNFGNSSELTCVTDGTESIESDQDA
jgi:hypothetical protein